MPVPGNNLECFLCRGPAHALLSPATHVSQPRRATPCPTSRLAARTLAAPLLATSPPPCPRASLPLASGPGPPQRPPPQATWWAPAQSVSNQHFTSCQPRAHPAAPCRSLVCSTSELGVWTCLGNVPPPAWPHAPLSTSPTVLAAPTAGGQPPAAPDHEAPGPWRPCDGGAGQAFRQGHAHSAVRPAERAGGRLGSLFIAC